MSVHTVAAEDVRLLREQVFAFMSQDRGLLKSLIAPSEAAVWEKSKQLKYVHEVVTSSLLGDEEAIRRVRIRESASQIRRGAKLLTDATFECSISREQLTNLRCRDAKEIAALLSDLISEVGCVWDWLQSSPKVEDGGSESSLLTNYVDAHVELVSVYVLCSAHKTFADTPRLSAKGMREYVEFLMRPEMLGYQNTPTVGSPEISCMRPQKLVEALSDRFRVLRTMFGCYEERRESDPKSQLAKLGAMLEKFSPTSAAVCVSSFIEAADLDQCWILNMLDLDRKLRSGRVVPPLPAENRARNPGASPGEGGNPGAMDIVGLKSGSYSGIPHRGDGNAVGGEKPPRDGDARENADTSRRRRGDGQGSDGESSRRMRASGPSMGPSSKRFRPGPRFVPGILSNADPAGGRDSKPDGSDVVDAAGRQSIFGEDVGKQERISAHDSSLENSGEVVGISSSQKRGGKTGGGAKRQSSDERQDELEKGHRSTGERGVRVSAGKRSRRVLVVPTEYVQDTEEGKAEGRDSDSALEHLKVAKKPRRRRSEIPDTQDVIEMFHDSDLDAREGRPRRFRASRPTSIDVRKDPVTGKKCATRRSRNFKQGPSGDDIIRNALRGGHRSLGTASSGSEKGKQSTVVLPVEDSDQEFSEVYGRDWGGRTGHSGRAKRTTKRIKDMQSARLRGGTISKHRTSKSRRRSGHNEFSFKASEDAALTEYIKKYGFGEWKRILAKGRNNGMWHTRTTRELHKRAQEMAEIGEG